MIRLDRQELLRPFASTGSIRTAGAEVAASIGIDHVGQAAWYRLKS
jgi:hypothetical protein